MGYMKFANALVVTENNWFANFTNFRKVIKYLTFELMFESGWDVSTYVQNTSQKYLSKVKNCRTLEFVLNSSTRMEFFINHFFAYSNHRRGCCDINIKIFLEVRICTVEYLN